MELNTLQCLHFQLQHHNIKILEYLQISKMSKTIEIRSITSEMNVLTRSDGSSILTQGKMLKKYL